MASEMRDAVLNCAELCGAILQSNGGAIFLDGGAAVNEISFPISRMSKREGRMTRNKTGPFWQYDSGPITLNFHNFSWA